ncbi:aminoacrylate hydrolase [Rhodoligotrophos appendicifer]|uniref:alpha/beta fold hydrolase n=1 Tax=Rhodoligotrophos appendicifer TaxID=987056 RepID=UPI001185E313|nr:alpha/beta fold hydrolase [Rhodoligotrophos appendicifer]
MSGTLRLPEGGKITYDRKGDGPPLVLVSGLGGRASFWDRVIPELTRHFTIITYDHLGTGRSSRFDGPYSIQGMADNLVLLMADIGVKSAVLVGHSTGGAICQEIAVNRPELIDRLILSATWTKACPYFTRLFQYRLESLDRGGLNLYRKLGVLLQYPPLWISENEVLVDAELNAPDPTDVDREIRITKARIQAILDHDLSAKIGSIDIPTLIVTAADDMVVPAYHSEQLERLIPGARRIVLANGGHFVPRTQKAAYAAVLLDFLRKKLQ